MIFQIIFPFFVFFSLTSIIKRISHRYEQEVSISVLCRINFKVISSLYDYWFAKTWHLFSAVSKCCDKEVEKCEVHIDWKWKKKTIERNVRSTFRAEQNGRLQGHTHPKLWKSSWLVIIWLAIIRLVVTTTHIRWLMMGLSWSFTVIIYHSRFHCCKQNS